MIELPVYLLRSSIVLAVLYVFYQLLLAKDMHYQRNRLYLIGSYGIALIIPLISFDFVVFPVELYKFSAMGYIDNSLLEHNDTGSISDHFSPIETIAFIYYLGCLSLGSLFIYRLLRLFVIIRSAPKQETASFTWVYVDQNISPFTFFKYLIINPTAKHKHNWNLILSHEQAHIKQRHSADLIIVELMIVLLWFNPLVWLMRRRITEIHEYQADEMVLSSDVDIKMYQKTLLEHMLVDKDRALISAFTSHLLKRRILMMQQHKKSRSPAYKLFLLVPILVLLVLMNTSAAQDQAFRCPLDEGRISSEFGMRLHPIKKKMIHHNGIDLAAATGTPVYAIANGKILETGNKNAAGHFVIIGHDDKRNSLYAQLEKYIVETDHWIKKGELIGYVGSSGISTAPHLHLEIHTEGVPEDPKTLIDFSELEY